MSGTGSSQRKGLLGALSAALGLDQQLLSPEHWVKIYGSKESSRRRNRIAETAFQAGAWLLSEAVEGEGRPTIARLAWESFARAALIDPGMADAYLLLFLLRPFGPKGVDGLDILDALRLTSSRLHEEQKRIRFPVHVHYSPLGFTEVEIATAEDCSLAYASEMVLLGRYQEAEVILDELHQGHELVQAVQARLAFNTDRIGDCEELLNHVISGSRLVGPDARWMRGVIRMGRQDYEGARADFERAEADSLDPDCTRSCREALAYLCAEIGDEEGEKHWIAELSKHGTLPRFLGGPNRFADGGCVEAAPEEIEAVEGVDYTEAEGEGSDTQLRNSDASTDRPDTSALMNNDAAVNDRGRQDARAGASDQADAPDRIDPELWRQVLQAFDGPPADDPTAG